jgi:hypothetical protein
MSVLRFGGLVLAALAIGLVVGCGGGGGGEPVDEGVTMTLGDVQIAGASGLERIDIPSPGGAITFTGLCGGTISRFARVGTGRIVFGSARAGGMTEIYVARPDGGGVTRVTNNSTPDEEPSWSPDGNTIVFCTGRDGGRTIYTMKADGSASTRLTLNTDWNCMPVWSPDGTAIAFSSYRDGNYEIYRMAPDGSGQTRLTNVADNDLHPSWAPDGTTIAFSSNRNVDSDIYKMNVDGTGQTQVTSTADNEIDPAWSPDGTRIAYVRLNGSGSGDICTITPEGASLTVLTSDGSDDQAPTWSPDGSQIMFCRDHNLWVMESDGDNPHALTTGALDDLATMSWSGNTAHVVRSLIGAAGSDGGSDPPFGTSRPLVIVGLRASGLVEAATISLPTIHWGTVTATGIDDTGYELAGVQIEAARIDGVQEDVGRGILPRYWNTSSGLITKSAAVFFSTTTGRISTIMATTISASSASADEAPRARVEGDRVLVTGPFAAVWTAPDTNVAPNGASEVELDATTGEVVAVR